MPDTDRMIDDIITELRASATVLLSTHKNPDGDALGSELALTLALEKLGKAVTVHNLDLVPEIYQFLPFSERVLSGRPVQGSYDALVVVDCEPGRTELYDGTYPARTLINIDHHVTNPKPWRLTWVDPDASATGEMTYRLLKKLDIPLDRDIALCLFAAIFTDTGTFRYTNTSPESLRISAELMEAGADPWLVTENVYESFAFRRIKLLGQVLAGMQVSADGTVGWVVVTEEMFRETGTSADDTENFVNYVRAVKGVEVAVLLRQTAARQYKVSLRSKGRADVSVVAQALGGGGHRNAAGCVLDGTLEQIRDRVVSAVEKALASRC